MQMHARSYELKKILIDGYEHFNDEEPIPEDEAGFRNTMRDIELGLDPKHPYRISIRSEEQLMKELGLEEL